MKKWYHNSRTGEIGSYTEAEGITDFPRGTLLAYGDYLTIGFNSLEEAKEWAAEWGACDKCRSSRKPNESGDCQFCGSPVYFAKQPYADRPATAKDDDPACAEIIESEHGDLGGRD